MKGAKVYGPGVVNGHSALRTQVPAAYRDKKHRADGDDPGERSQTGEIYEFCVDSNRI